jgi:hypothetical protein
VVRKQEAMNGNLPSPTNLDKKIGRNTVFKGVLSLAPPCWLYNPECIERDQRMSSVIIAFYDPDKKTYDHLTKTWNAITMYGTFVTMRPFKNWPSFFQCPQCLHLGHSVECCNQPSSLIVCPHCGGPHTASKHAFRYPSTSKHRGRQCTCPPRCFLCCKKKKKGKGHNALSSSCLLHSLYHTPLTDSDDMPSTPLTSQKDHEGDVHLPDALPLMPGASGPFTMITPSTSEALKTLHAQGASADNLVCALVPDEEFTELTRLQNA